MSISRRGRRVATVCAAALGAILAPPVVEPASAAPYLASCQSGVYAPQACTFVATTVIGAFASVGEYAIVAPVRPTVAPPSCPNGAVGRIEEYAGRVRSGDVVGSFGMRLTACPQAHPVISATVRFQTGNTQYSIVSGRFGPDGGIDRFWFQRSERDYPVGTAGGLNTKGVGDVFRRDTGMAVSADGRYTRSELTASNGVCEMGCDYGTYRARVDSSISGHWARLALVETEDSEPSAETPTREYRRSTTAQPVGAGGWRITRVS